MSDGSYPTGSNNRNISTASGSYICPGCGIYVVGGLFHACGGVPHFAPPFVSTPLPSTPDLEIRAMIDIAAALEPLDMGARERVIDWALSRFGSAPGLGRP